MCAGITGDWLQLFDHLLMILYQLFGKLFYFWVLRLLGGKLADFNFSLIVFQQASCEVFFDFGFLAFAVLITAVIRGVLLTTR